MEFSLLLSFPAFKFPPFPSLSPFFPFILYFPLLFSQDWEVNKKVKKYELNRVWAVAYKDINLDQPF